MEGVGAVGEVGDGEADPVVAEEGGKADQGVGKAVRLTDAVAEKLVLGGTRFAGREGEFDALDGCGKLEGFESGLEWGEDDLGGGGGLGKINDQMI
jgi:hypothetical protein